VKPPNKCKNSFFDLDIYDKKPRLDFVIGNNNRKILFPKTRYIEFAFPNFNTHYLYNSPYPSINGFAIFLNQIINNL